jgi:energy-coupling factor transport system ATP-binding protein
VAAARLSGLTYWYPGGAIPSLDEVTLEIEPGLTLVAGPSGGGKSTLLRVLNGLVPHFHGGRIKGVATVEGLDVIATPTRCLARNVGFVFQDPELQAVYDTVEREVAFGLENIATPPRVMHELVDAALHEVGIEHLRRRRMRTLSGGERQRVALASVLAMQPSLVVLDEPTSQLDPDGATRVLAAATRAATDGRSVVISEHRLQRLLPAAAAIATVEQGKVGLHPADGWQPPRSDLEPSRETEPGAVAWSLTRVTAGHAGRVVLGDIDLAGRHREVLALAGPNGSGKTTLLRTIAGALAPLAGKVERAPGRLAYLPQYPTALLHRPTVQAEVDVTLEWAGETAGADEILAALGLTAVAGRYARDLSSGERQRAALAAVLVGRPAVVLLDEPTRGMDTIARAALCKLVASLRDAGAAIVIATHDEELQAAVADRVVDVCGGTTKERARVTP